MYFVAFSGLGFRGIQHKAASKIEKSKYERDLLWMSGFRLSDLNERIGTQKFMHGLRVFV